METNIYYQLAQTECVLDRCKAKLFKKNLLLAGMMAVLYLSAKALTMETKKVVEVQKERDEAVEAKDAAEEELRQIRQKESEKTIHCDGHATLSKD